MRNIWGHLTNLPKRQTRNPLQDSKLSHHDERRGRRDDCRTQDEAWAGTPPVPALRSALMAFAVQAFLAECRAWCRLSETAMRSPGMTTCAGSVI